YVAMKPIVENMGLNWPAQQQKLNKNKVKFNCIDIHIVAGDGKKREMTCMSLKKFNGWLFSVNPEKISETKIKVKEKVIKYQEECFHVLHNYWFGKNKEEISVANPLTLPDFSNPVAAARAWADAKEGELKLQIELKEAEPKIAFAEHMEQTPDTISVGEFAKYMKKKGYDIGPKKLFQKFRDLKYFRYNSKGVNEPYQRVIDYGWFEFNEYTMDSENSEGEKKKRLCSKIMITGKGQVSISKILLRELDNKEV
ncbi:phage antirepressor KilAC domain-containing protein, partial [Candidatus Pacearchaeota archaeon]|nr:phage antirepressor KilAC domain-containing protein [Candidatus Pacearchaeota archaeon]